MIINGDTASSDYWYAWNDVGSDGAVYLVYDTSLRKNVIEFGVNHSGGWGSFWGNNSITNNPNNGLPWFSTGSLYTITFKGKIDSGSSDRFVAICDPDGSNLVWATTITLTSTWQTFTFTFNPKQQGNNPYFYIWGNPGHTVRVTGLSIRRSQ
jgi:hypothetical protein